MRRLDGHNYHFALQSSDPAQEHPEMIRSPIGDNEIECIAERAQRDRVVEVFIFIFMDKVVSDRKQRMENTVMHRQPVQLFEGRIM